VADLQHHSQPDENGQQLPSIVSLLRSHIRTLRDHPGVMEPAVSGSLRAIALQLEEVMIAVSAAASACEVTSRETPHIVANVLDEVLKHLTGE
jgi:hypothetical protein